MNIGFIGFGEASSNIAEGLLTNENCHVFAYDNNYEHAQQVRSSMLNNDRIKLLDSVESLLKEVENIFVAIPGMLDKSLMFSILSPPPFFFVIFA